MSITTNNQITVIIPQSGINPITQDLFARADQIAKGNIPEENVLAQARTVASYALLDFGLNNPDSTQSILAKQAGLSLYDLIFIDGKPASEVYGQLRDPEHTEEENLEALRTALAGTLLSGKNRVEVASLSANADRSVQINVTALKLDVTAVQPDRNEGHSWFRRTFFNWGPFRCKSVQDRIDALYAKDSGKEARQTALAQQLEQKATAGSAAYREEELRVKRERIHQTANEKVAEADRYMNELEEAFFGHIGADLDGRNKQFMELKTSNGLTTIDRVSSRASFVCFCMMAEGRSVEEICAATPEEKRAAGETAYTVLQRGDRMEITDIFMNAADRMMQETLPPVDINDPEEVIANASRYNMFQSLLKDHEQIQGKKKAEDEYPVLMEERFGQRYEQAALALDAASRYVEAMNQLSSYYTKPEVTEDLNAPANGTLYRVIGSKAFLDKYHENFSGKRIGENGTDPVQVFRNQGESFLVFEKIYDREQEFRRPCREALLAGAPNPVAIESDGSLSVGRRSVTRVQELHREEGLTQGRQARTAGGQMRAAEQKDFQVQALKGKR